MPEHAQKDPFDSMLFYAANTDDVIRWDDLHKRLLGGPPAISERERCEYLIAAVNGERLTGRQWNQLVGAPIQRGADERAVPIPARGRAAFAGNLSAIVEGNAKGRSEVAAKNLAALTRNAIRVVSQNVLTSVSLSRRSGEKHHILARDMQNALAFSVWLMLDPRRPFGRALCRCEYSHCTHFFFKRPAEGGRGAPNRKYCTPEHRTFGENEKARKRMIEVRRNNK